MGKFLVELLMNSNYGKVISLVCLIVFAVVYLSIPRNNYVICNSKDQECTVYQFYDLADMPKHVVISHF